MAFNMFYSISVSLIIYLQIIVVFVCVSDFHSKVYHVKSCGNEWVELQCNQISAINHILNRIACHHSLERFQQYFLILATQRCSTSINLLEEKKQLQSIWDGIT